MRVSPNDSIFLNSDYVVIEYMDLIKSPYFVLLDVIRTNKRLNEILDLDSLSYMNQEELYEWYVKRKHQNFLIDLNRFPDEITNEELDDILRDQMNLTPHFYTDGPLLLMEDFLKVARREKLAKDIIIYFPYENDFAKKDLEFIMGTDYTFMNNFDEVLDLCKENSTYFLSDINKVLRMKEKGYLEFSSITLPIEYRYNKKNTYEFKLDFESLYKETVFKLSYMHACSYESEALADLNDYSNEK